MAITTKNIPFGMADFTISNEDGEIKFDGKNEFQADSGEVTLTPGFEDIVVQDLGTGLFDQILVSWEGEVTIVAAQESIEVLQLAMGATDPIIDSSTAEIIGFTDAAIGSSMRERGRKVNIHRRSAGADNRSQDITIYKMASIGEFAQTYGMEQGNVTITMTMFPRDDMDAAKPGNFFFRGPKDPNEPVPAAA